MMPWRGLTRNPKKILIFFAAMPANGPRRGAMPTGLRVQPIARKIHREKFFTTKNGLSCLELFLVITRENYDAGTKETTTVGPVYAVQVPGDERPLVLLMYPAPRKLASAAVSQDAREIIESVEVHH